MRLRSLLFVPGDSERKFARAQTAGADALILDLEDSVAPARKTEARHRVAGLIAAHAGPRDWRFFVRANPADTGLELADLAAIVQPGLDGLLVPKANSAADIVRIGHYLDALEQRAGMVAGTVKIAVVATETATAMFHLGSYAPAHARLAALTWGAEDLAAALGVTENKDASGEWRFPYKIARAQCLFGAAQAGVAAVDTLYANFRDPEGLARASRASRSDGFAGRLAIHPDQVATINACYAPSAAEIEQAQKIVSAFAAAPDAGTLGIDGKMYDIPHLTAAKRLLAAAG